MSYRRQRLIRLRCLVDPRHWHAGRHDFGRRISTRILSHQILEGRERLEAALSIGLAVWPCFWRVDTTAREQDKFECRGYVPISFVQFDLLRLARKGSSSAHLSCRNHRMELLEE